MKSHDLLYIKDIVSSLEKIGKYMHGLSDAEFLKNEEKQEAILLNLQIIGEASGKLSKNLKEKHHEVEWRKLSRLRNFIVHEYFNIDSKDVLYFVKNDLKTIKGQVRAIQ